MICPSVYAIEGMGNIGKSTLVNHLAARHYRTIPEIAESNPETLEIQKFTCDAERARKVNDWFLAQEIERGKSALRGGPVFMDRSVYSQLSYNFARDRLNGLKETSYVLQRIEELNGLVPLPRMIYLAASAQHTEKVRAQAKSRDSLGIGKVDPQMTRPFLDMMEVAFRQIAGVLREHALTLFQPMPLDALEGRIKLFCQAAAPHQVGIKDLRRALL